METDLKEENKELQSQVEGVREVFEQIYNLPKQPFEMHAERKAQLKDLARLLQNRNEDPLRKMAYCIIDGIRRTALGESGAFLEALLQIAPSEVTKNIRNLPQLTEELRIAVMNLVGLSSKGKCG